MTNGFSYAINVDVLGGGSLQKIIALSSQFESKLSGITSGFSDFGGTTSQVFDRLDGNVSTLETGLEGLNSGEKFGNLIGGMDNLNTGLTDAIAKSKTLQDSGTGFGTNIAALSPTATPSLVDQNPVPQSKTFFEKAKTPIFAEGGLLGKYEPAIAKLNERYGNFIDKVSTSSEKLTAPIEGMFGKVLLLNDAFENRILPSLDSFSNKYLGKSITEIYGVSTALQYWQSGLDMVNLAYGVYTTVAEGASIVTDIMTASQTALNWVLSINPIGLVIVGVAALAAGFAYAWNKSETFRASMYGVWEVMKTLGGFIYDYMIPPLWALGEVLIGVFTFDSSLISKGMDDAVSAFNKNVDNFMNAGTKLGSAFTDSSCSMRVIRLVFLLAVCSQRLGPLAASATTAAPAAG